MSWICGQVKSLHVHEALPLFGSGPLASRTSPLIRSQPETPATAPYLNLTSTMLQPRIVGNEHYETAQRVKETLQRY
jgi:hypothetical protein